MEKIMQELEEVFQQNFWKDEPMNKHTSFKIGGTADYFVKTTSEEQLKWILKFAQKQNLPFFILGNGTNLLVQDGGIRGIVIQIQQNDYAIEKQKEFAFLTVKAGMTLARLAFIASENGLTGLEELSGIPGTIGGAIKMNAGAYGREMKDIVISSRCMDTMGNIREINLQEHQFGYRKSAFETNGLILLETTIKLEYGSKEKIQQKMAEYKTARMEKQPLEFPNAGSTFKRIANKPTAKMIEEAGLKGFHIGDAEVSTKHAGFIVNKGKATSKDVLELVKQIQKSVKEKFNQEIELEIIVMGEE